MLWVQKLLTRRLTLMFGVHFNNIANGFMCVCVFVSFDFYIYFHFECPSIIIYVPMCTNRISHDYSVIRLAPVLRTLILSYRRCVCCTALLPFAYNTFGHVCAQRISESFSRDVRFHVTISGIPTNTPDHEGEDPLQKCKM